MSKKCHICIHPRREEIDKILVSIKYSTATYRNLAQVFDISVYSLTRHRKNHINALLKQDREVQEILSGATKDLVGQTEHFLKQAKDMLAAADKWLRDPASGEIILDPRDTEVTVYYLDASSGKEVHRQAPLSELLAKIERKEKTIMVTGWRYKHADPRELMLKAIDRGVKVIELLGKLSGELQVLPDLELIIELVVEALRPHPESLEQVLEGLRQSGAPINN